MNKQSFEYYASAGFPSGTIETMVFDTRQQAEKQCQQYADRGAVATSLRKEPITNIYGVGK